MQRNRQRRFGTMAAAARAVALAAGLVFVGVSGALAQESTPAAMGTAECVAPEMAAESAGMAASPAASPTDDSAAAGMPADEALAAEVTAALETYTACYNEGDYAAALALTTSAFRMDLFDTDDIAAVAEGFAGVMELPAVEILSLGDVMTYDDGRVSIDSEYMSGEYQYVKSRTFMVQEGDTFLVDGEDYLPATPDGDATIISYTIADDTSALAFDQSTASPEFPVVVLYGANNGAERHTVALLRLPDEAAGTPVADLPVEQVMGGELIGSVLIDAGEREELVMVGLPAGTYLLIDPLVPGSAATLTISEPETES